MKNVLDILTKMESDGPVSEDVKRAIKTTQGYDFGMTKSVKENFEAMQEADEEVEEVEEVASMGSMASGSVATESRWEDEQDDDESGFWNQPQPVDCPECEGGRYPNDDCSTCGGNGQIFEDDDEFGGMNVIDPAGYRRDPDNYIEDPTDDEFDQDMEDDWDDDMDEDAGAANDPWGIGDDNGLDDDGFPGDYESDDAEEYDSDHDDSVDYASAAMDRIHDNVVARHPEADGEVEEGEESDFPQYDDQPGDGPYGSNDGDGLGGPGHGENALGRIHDRVEARGGSNGDLGDDPWGLGEDGGNEVEDGDARREAALGRVADRAAERDAGTEELPGMDDDPWGIGEGDQETADAEDDEMYGMDYDEKTDSLLPVSDKSAARKQGQKRPGEEGFDAGIEEADLATTLQMMPASMVKTSQQLRTWMMQQMAVAAQSADPAAEIKQIMQQAERIEVTGDNC